MTTVKVIPDTNVIISASISESFPEIPEGIRHRFYDELIQLFSLFKKTANKKMGIVLPTVEKESSRVLKRAVIDVFHKHESANPHTQKRFFDSMSILATSSHNKRKMLLSRLNRITIKPDDVCKNLSDVMSMSRDLRKLYDQKYKNSEKKKEEARQRAKSSERRHDAFEAHRIEIRNESKQM